MIATLTQGNLRNHAEPVLRRYIDHQDPQLRAKAITALANAGADDVGDLIERGLKDPATEVRTATAKRLLQICNQLGLQQTAAVAGGEVIEVEVRRNDCGRRKFNHFR